MCGRINFSMYFLYRAFINFGATATFLSPQTIQVTEHYECGKIRATFCMERGMLNGLDTFYSPNGDVLSKDYYTDGILT